MGDYTTAHCFLLLGNPTTNIKYINGATMADDLAKYEALANSLDEGWPSTPRPAYFEIATVIIELVAMVRNERAVRQTVEFHSEERWQKVAGANLIAANNALEKRAAAAERERDEARDLTWFWQIVDRNGLADVCSDERGALAELARAHRELAELKRKMNE